MIVDENVTDYLRSLIREEDAFLERIEREARKNHVPIVKPETKEFLKLLVLMKQPMKILEVGTAVGFSSLYMHKFQPEGGTVVTIERNEGRIQVCGGTQRPDHSQADAGVLIYTEKPSFAGDICASCGRRGGSEYENRRVT